MQSYQNMSDEELIAALRSGEKEITDYLMDKYKSLVKKKAKALYLIGGEILQWDKMQHIPAHHKCFVSLHLGSGGMKKSRCAI